VEQLLADLRRFAALAHIHECKEIENYLLVPKAIERALEKRILEKAARTGSAAKSCDDVEETLRTLTDGMKSRVNAQFRSRRRQYLRAANPHLDPATLDQRMLEDFEKVWQGLEGRLRVVPGKDLLAALNRHLQETYSVTVTPSTIVNAMNRDDVPESMLSLVSRLEDFRRAPVPDGERK